MSPINSSISHSFATATTFPKIVTNGLIFHYDAGQQNSYNGIGTIWRDISGFGNPTDGTLTNGPTFSSANGGILVFDGTDTYIRASNSKLIHRTANWTYTFTINFNTLTQLYEGFFESGRTSGDFFLMRYANFGGGSQRIILISRTSSTTFEKFVSFIPSTGVWYHLTFVKTGSSVDFYRNGVYSSTISDWNADINPSTTSEFIYIANEQQDSRPLKGKMANFIVYNRAITAAEVKQNFDAIRGRFGI